MPSDLALAAVDAVLSVELCCTTEFFQSPWSITPTALSKPAVNTTAFSSHIPSRLACRMPLRGVCGALGIFLRIAVHRQKIYMLRGMSRLVTSGSAAGAVCGRSVRGIATARSGVLLQARSVPGRPSPFGHDRRQQQATGRSGQQQPAVRIGQQQQLRQWVENAQLLCWRGRTTAAPALTRMPPRRT